MSKGNKQRRKALGRLPVREKCIAHNQSGKPCGKYPVEGAVVCASHGGAAPQVKRKAAERMMMAQDDAASLLVRFMNDPAVPWGERRRCAEFILTWDKASEINVTLAAWAEDIDGLLYEPPIQDVVEGEVIEEQRLPARAVSEVLGPEDSEPSWVGGNRYRHQ